MTTEDLLSRCKDRLSKSGNPALPPEETLSAILELGEEKWKAIEERDELNSKLYQAIKDKESAENKLTAALSELDKVKKFGEEQAWLAMEFLTFIKAVSNHEYDGNEPAAASRVYNLNSDQITKRPLNAFMYNSQEEARAAYERVCIAENKEFSIVDFVKWLYSHRPFQAR